MNKKGEDTSGMALGAIVLVILVFISGWWVYSFVLTPGKEVGKCESIGGICSPSSYIQMGDKYSCANNYFNQIGYYCDKEKGIPCCKPTPGTTPPQTGERPTGETSTEEPATERAEKELEEAVGPKGVDMNKLIVVYEDAKAQIKNRWEVFDYITIKSFNTLIQARDYLGRYYPVEMNIPYPDEQQCMLYAVAFKGSLERGDLKNNIFKIEMESLLATKDSFFKDFGSTIIEPDEPVVFPICNKIKDIKTIEDLEKNDWLLEDDTFAPYQDVDVLIPSLT